MIPRINVIHPEQNRMLFERSVHYTKLKDKLQTQLKLAQCRESTSIGLV